MLRGRLRGNQPHKEHKDSSLSNLMVSTLTPLSGCPKDGDHLCTGPATNWGSLTRHALFSVKRCPYLCPEASLSLSRGVRTSVQYETLTSRFSKQTWDTSVPCDRGFAVSPQPIQRVALSVLSSPAPRCGWHIACMVSPWRRLRLSQQRDGCHCRTDTGRRAVPADHHRGDDTWLT